MYLTNCNETLYYCLEQNFLYTTNVAKVLFYQNCIKEKHKKRFFHLRKMINGVFPATEILFFFFYSPCAIKLNESRIHLKVSFFFQFPLQPGFRFPLLIHSFIEKNSSLYFIYRFLWSTLFNFRLENV